MSGRMVYNSETGIYEQEQDPRQYVTGSMIYNHKDKIWEPRNDNPTNMYGSNYVPNASQTMQYNNNTMLWEQRQPSAKKNNKK